MRTSSLIIASLATAAIAFGAILGSGPAQAGKGCCKQGPDKTRGGTKICKIDVGGPNHQQTIGVKGVDLLMSILVS